MISKEQELAASFYGKFFAKNLNLYLLRRRPEEWRNLQSGRRQQEKSNTTQSAKDQVKPPTEGVFEDRKRKNRSEDDIDALFNDRVGKKKKVSLSVIPSASSNVSSGKLRSESDSKGVEDRELEQVLGAIRLAPKSNPSPKRNKDKKSRVL